jgi:hypothetical protein
MIAGSFGIGFKIFVVCPPCPGLGRSGNEGNGGAAGHPSISSNFRRGDRLVARIQLSGGIKIFRDRLYQGIKARFF